MTNIRISCISAVLLLFALPLVGAAQAQSTGTVTGRVVDAETDAPLSGVNVTLQRSNVGAATNENGQFHLPDVPVGADTLLVQFVGYRTLERPLTIRAGETVNVQLSLRPEAVEMRGIEVSARSPRPEPSGTLPDRRIQEAKVSDTGTLLRNVAGVNAARRGALGLDLTFAAFRRQRSVSTWTACVPSRPAPDAWTRP